MAFGGTIIGRGVIPVTIDRSGVDRDLNDLEKTSTGKFAAIGKKAGAALGVAAGATALIGGKFLTDSIGRASDLGEVLSKSAQIFGKDMIPALEKFAGTAAKTLGQSKTAALDAASTFGVFGKMAGLTGKDLVGFSTKMVRLSSDMASFSNTSPQEAVEALGAALRGESEPIRRYGVMLDDATLKAEALALGILKPVKDEAKIRSYQVRIIEGQKAYNDAVAEFGPKSLEALKAQANLSTLQTGLEKATTGTIPPLTAQQKVLAAQSAIMKQTKDQQGDFARTSDGLANQQRILKARFEDISTSIGQKFLPAAVKVAQWANDDLIPGLEKGWKYAERFGKTVGEFIGSPAVQDALGKVRAGVGGIVDTWGKIMPVLAPVAKFLLEVIGGAVIGAIQGAITFLTGIGNIIGGIINTWKAIFEGNWKAVWEGLGQILGGILDAIVGAIQVWWNLGILNIFRKGALELVGSVRGMWTSVKESFQAARERLVGLIVAMWHNLTGAVVASVRDIVTRVGDMWDNVKDAFRAGKDWVANVFKSAWGKVEEYVLDPVRNARDAVGRIFGEGGPVRGAFDAVKDWGRDVFKAAWGKIEDWILDPVRNARDAIGNIFGPEGPVRTAFKDGVDAIERIWNGIKKAAAVPVNFVIDTVWNNGLREVIGKLPGVSTPGKVGLIEWGEGKADGGPITGGIPGRDSVRALLMPGEHVWTTEEVRKAGGHRAMRRLRDLAKRGRLAELGDIGAPAFADGGNLTDEDRRRAAAWAQAQVGKPYIWGGTGPGGFDCSGFMSGIVNVLRGGSGFGGRLGTTANFPWSGFKSGYGEFTIGSAKTYGSTGVGHMAGTLAGLNVESAGGIGPRVGATARGASDSGFNQHYHLGRSGKDAGEKSGFWDAIDAIKDTFAKFKGWLSELAAMGGWGGLIKQTVTGVIDNLKDWLDSKIPGPSIFDRGGYLTANGGRNLSGKPERVLSPRQTVAFERLVDDIVRGPGFPGDGPGYGGSAALRADAASGGPSVTVHAPQNTDPYQIADIAAGNLAAILKGA